MDIVNVCGILWFIKKNKEKLNNIMIHQKKGHYVCVCVCVCVCACKQKIFTFHPTRCFSLTWNPKVTRSFSDASATHLKEQKKGKIQPRKQNH